MRTGPRITCCVPFCRRTRGERKDDTRGMPAEWVCAEHWRGVPQRYRRAYARRKREAEAALAVMVFNLEIVSAFKAADRLWERCKRAAIERAGGIG